MVVLNLWSGFGLGFIGGFVPEFMGLYALRREAPGNFPRWVKSPRYWLLSVMMMIFGGGIVMLYLASGVALNLPLALNLGASAPLILRSLGNQVVPDADIPTN